MRVAINYSPTAAELADVGDIDVDIFKCPAWPELLERLADRPTYMHFPLMLGRHYVMNSEANAPADFEAIAALRKQTQTPYVNVHFAAFHSDYPDIPIDSLHAEHVHQIVEDAIRGVQALQNRFGRDAVIMENVEASDTRLLWACEQPEAIQQVIEATGCGLLLDVSHARLAAGHMGMDEKIYLESLPVNVIREIHVTGIDLITEQHLQGLQSLGIHESLFHRYLGRKVDHLPFTDEDWPMLEWVFEKIRTNEWQAPDIVAFEYGGVGGIWEKLSDETVIREQMPRLYSLVKDAEPNLGR